MDQHTRLSNEEILKTIDNLFHRISERFPGSGLAGVAQTLIDLARETERTLLWIARPNYLLRAGIYVLIALLSVTIFYSISKLNISADGIGLSDFVQMIDSALNGLVLIGAGAVFLVTFEKRRKRERIVDAVNKLRCIAHIIDMHQLTKDPDVLCRTVAPTDHSPKRTLSRQELGRYLDYCTEMLALLSKTSFLYIQHFPDPVATDAVNDLENLTTDLSRKIWQKIMILQRTGIANPVDPVA